MFRRLWFVSLPLIAAYGATSATITGKITDKEGKPLADTTVMVYSAGARQGYSTYCPTCYVDCGKRATTDLSGSFSIAGLDPELWFNLLVVRDGYTPNWIKHADPAQGATATVLVPRAAVNDSSRIARGHVVDTQGKPVRGAVVTPEALFWLAGEQHSATSAFAPQPGLEMIAVTNAKGEFELAHSRPFEALLIRVQARAMADKVVRLPSGVRFAPVTLLEGATVRGRLLSHGRPAAGLEVGLAPQAGLALHPDFQVTGDAYPEMRVGTREDGTFAFFNVPTPVNWHLYGKMSALGSRGATTPIVCATARDGQDINVGDLEIRPAYHLRGTVKLADGAALAGGMRILLLAANTRDSQLLPLHRDGSFEFTGLARGSYTLFIYMPGYRQRDQAPIDVRSDIDDFVVLVDPVVKVR